MTKNLVCWCLSLLLLGCTSMKSQHRLSTNIQAVEFNSISSKYMNRPTFLSILEMNDGSELLSIKMDSYRSDANGIMPNIAIDKKYIDENVKLIKKYIEWHDLALDRKDQLSKEIGKVNAWNSNENRYSFHSGNEYNHYLEIVTCVLGTCNPSGRSPIMLDKNGAQDLLKELEKFKLNQLSMTNLDTVYN